MRVYISEDICQGHTMCAMTAPQVFGLRDEDGHAYLLDVELTPEVLEAAKRAALNCPEQAIVVEN